MDSTAFSVDLYAKFIPTVLNPYSELYVYPRLKEAVSNIFLDYSYIQKDDSVFTETSDVIIKNPV